MPRFLVEVPHQPETLTCARIVRAFLSSGNHYLTHADWGCRVVALNKFTIDQMDAVLGGHGARWRDGR